MPAKKTDSNKGGKIYSFRRVEKELLTFEKLTSLLPALGWNTTCDADLLPSVWAWRTFPAASLPPLLNHWSISAQKAAGWSNPSQAPNALFSRRGHTASVRRRITLTLHGALSKCIVGPSMLTAPLPALKVEKCSTFQAAKEPSARQITLRKYKQVHCPMTSPCNTTRDNTWIRQSVDGQR